MRGLVHMTFLVELAARARAPNVVVSRRGDAAIQAVGDEDGAHLPIVVTNHRFTQPDLEEHGGPFSI